MGSVTRREQAKLDLLEQAYYIALDNQEASEAFLQAAEAAFELLAQHPEMGARREFQNPQFVGLRMWPIRGFEYHLVFYRPIESGIEVVRVLHANRDIPGILG